MTRLLIISHDVIDDQMAGPGVRYWQMARALAKRLDVTLATPGASLPDGGFASHIYAPGRWETLVSAASKADALLINGHLFKDFPQLEHCGKPLIIEATCPYTFETLHLNSDLSREQQMPSFLGNLKMVRQIAMAGDFYFCGNHRQRDYWLGVLDALGRINPDTYSMDPTLSNLIDVVAFGLPSHSPEHRVSSMKGVMPGIARDDRVVLWGGGLWQWLDPLTCVRALARLLSQHANLRLVFPGTRHPNPIVPEMPMLGQTRELSDQLGLTDKVVFFGDWVPYAQWPSYLLEADIGVSMHFDTLETRFAFRTRVLDYLWAGLPMVVSGGDETSDLIKRHGLGEVVPPGDDKAAAAALDRLLHTPDLRQTYRERFERVRPLFTWEHTCEPIVRFCQQPRFAPDRASHRVMLQVPAEEASSTRVSQLEEELERKQSEIEQLRALVQGYERGRFIRLMRWIKQGRKQPPLENLPDVDAESCAVEMAAPAVDPDLKVVDVTAYAADIDLDALDVIRWAPVWMSRAERLLLFSLVFGSRPERYLEIGTYKGGSTLVVAAAMDASGAKGRMMCIDPTPEIDAAHWAQLEHRATLLQAYSPDILPEAYRLAGGPFDFVLIDGDHTYEGVMRDATGVLPFVADGAYLLFHDSFFSEVAQAISEFAHQHQEQIVDFGILTREITVQSEPQTEPIHWGGLRLMQVRRT